MKKRIAIYFAVMCTIISVTSTIAFAAAPNYCQNCGATVTEYGENIRHWTEIHKVYTGNTINGVPIMQDCTIYYSLDRVGRVCNNGCGLLWSEDRQSEIHTGSNCPLNK